MAAKQQPKRTMRPPQKQTKQPGVQRQMRPAPVVVADHYRPSGKLEGKVAIVTGGDSGIGRSVAVYLRDGGRGRRCSSISTNMTTPGKQNG